MVVRSLSAFLAVAVLAALSCSVVSAQGGVQLTPTAEVFDGPVTDIAGPSSSSETTPEDQRVWIASGRNRVALRVSDRQRMEVETFSGFASPYKELVLAVELLEERDELYTLTDRGIYREDVSDPSNPVPLSTLDFENALMREVVCTSCPWPPYTCCSENDVPFDFVFEGELPANKVEMDDAFLDLKVWAGPTIGDDRLFLMTTERIVVIMPRLNPMLVQSYAGELFDNGGNRFTPPTDLSIQDQDDFNDAKLVSLRKMRIVEDGSRLMAYVLAFSNQLPNAWSIRADLHALVACDLDRAGGFDDPTFSMDSVDVEYQWWSPDYSAITVESTAIEMIRRKTIWDFDLYQDGASRYAILALGCENQLQRIDITDAFSQAVGHFSPVAITGVTDSNPLTCFDPCYAIRADPSASHRYLVGSTQEFHVVDAVNPASPIVSHSIDEPLSSRVGVPRTAKRDMLVMETADEMFPPGPLPPFTNDHLAAWVGIFKGATDHHLKIFDVTTNANPVTLFDEQYSMASSDGGVAIPEDWNVYLPTFGGVVRFTSPAQDGTDWEVVPDSHQAAEETVGANNVQRNTEHIDIARFAVAQEDRILTAAGSSELASYDINSVTGDHSAPEWAEPISTLMPANWIPPYSGTDYYANDVAFVDLAPTLLSDHKYALTILTRKDSTMATFPTEHAVLAFLWDVSQVPPRWVHVDTAVSPPIDHVQGTTNNANTITISEGYGTTWAFVGHQEGFFWFDLAPLLTASPLTIPTTQSADYPGEQKVNVGSVFLLPDPDPLKGRIFVCRENRDLFEIWAWDPTLCSVTAPCRLARFRDSALPGLPGSTVPSVFRGRYHEYPTPTANGVRGMMHLAAVPYYLQLTWPKYDSSTGTLDYDAFEFVGYWEGDYSSNLQDCRLYDFGTTTPDWHALVVKDEESFATIPFDGDGQ